MNSIINVIQRLINFIILKQINNNIYHNYNELINLLYLLINIYTSINKVYYFEILSHISFVYLLLLFNYQVKSEHFLVKKNKFN
jgi:hypothetical protein